MRTEPRHLRSQFDKRKPVILVSVLILLLLGIGSTVAFLISTPEPVVNVFEGGVVACQVVETFDGEVKSDVKIQNTGTVAAYIRATYVATWVNDETGDTYYIKPAAGTGFTISYNAADWTLEADGYYYYNAAVSPEDSTSVFIKECKPVSDAAPEGYHLEVEILASAIQEPANPGSEVWTKQTQSRPASA